MPLTKLGQKMLDKFNRQYDSRGEKFFYSWLNKKSPKEKRKYEK